MTLRKAQYKKKIYILLTLACLLMSTPSFAQYTTLLNFEGTTNGDSPNGSLISDGTFLYGMTQQGGTNNGGTIFKMLPDGTGYVKLFDFGATNGCLPTGSLISDGTFLYGMTSECGPNDSGTIFKIMPDGTGYVKLFDFGTTIGRRPRGSLISDGTFLYGTTHEGGTNSLGTIFKILPDGTGYAKLLDFAGATNGSTPLGSLISDGTFLYGMTSDANIPSDLGTTFKILPDGTGYVKLLDFAGATNGSTPWGSLISDGTFMYGMTAGGGTNDLGTIFKMLPDGTGYVKLLDFAGTTNGSTPLGSLISDGTFLYGMTAGGGTYSGGTIFKMLPDGTGYVKLLDFTGTPNGSSPTGSLISDGTFLYGMTNGGGTNSLGTIFKYCITPLTATATNTGTYCQGATIQLNSTGGDSYLWSGPNSYMNATQNPTITGATLAMAGDYTVTVTNAAGCGNSVTTTVTINPLPTVTANTTATSVCPGESVTLTGSGADTYTWTGGAMDGIGFNPPLGNNTYTVTGTDVNGCVNMDQIDVIVNPLPMVTANTTATSVCAGTNITLTGSGADTYTWTGGAMDGIGFIPPIGNTSYTVTGTDGNGCVNIDQVDIIVNPLPTVTANTTANIVCAGANITLTGAGADTYTWTSGVTDGIAFVTPGGVTTYTVTGIISATGCENTASVIITGETLPIQNVCVVGIDSLTNNNRVVWEKPITTAIDSFYVYRETAVANVYEKVGARLYDSLSVWLDPTSDPTIQAYRYKTAALDTCGTETPLSDFHKTIHLTISQGVAGAWNLIWSHYEGLTFASYNIYSGSDPSSMSLLTTIQSTLNSYTHTPPAGNVYYQIEIINPNNCSPTKAINYSSSKSNIVSNNSSGLIEYSNSEFEVYPNPANKEVYIHSLSKNIGSEFALSDYTGRIVLKGKIEFEKTKINVEGLAAGNYLFNIGEEQPVKLMIE